MQKPEWTFWMTKYIKRIDLSPPTLSFIYFKVLSDDSYMSQRLAYKAILVGPWIWVAYYVHQPYDKWICAV